MSCAPGLEIHSVGVTAWVYNRFPYMRSLLTRQVNEIEPATYDARTNNRNHRSIGAPQAPLANTACLLTFRCIDVLNEIDNRIFSESGLNLSDSNRIRIFIIWRPDGFGFWKSGMWSSLICMHRIEISSGDAGFLLVRLEPLRIYRLTIVYHI